MSLRTAADWREYRDALQDALRQFEDGALSVGLGDQQITRQDAGKLQEQINLCNFRIESLERGRSALFGRTVRTRIDWDNYDYEDSPLWG